MMCLCVQKMRTTHGNNNSSNLQNHGIKAAAGPSGIYRSKSSVKHEGKKPNIYLFEKLNISKKLKIKQVNISILVEVWHFQFYPQHRFKSFLQLVTC